ncbi:hypothetical protein B0H14DRAFT_3439700 [Mycena olivaceomarginata]|nr:hypothetical protein B0H14DRAFT_3439700 [Mycena olivaceomarginata]
MGLLLGVLVLFTLRYIACGPLLVVTNQLLLFPPSSPSIPSFPSASSASSGSWLLSTAGAACAGSASSTTSRSQTGAQSVSNDDTKPSNSVACHVAYAAQYRCAVHLPEKQDLCPTPRTRPSLAPLNTESCLMALLVAALLVSAPIQIHEIVRLPSPVGSQCLCPLPTLSAAFSCIAGSPTPRFWPFPRRFRLFTTTPIFLRVHAVQILLGIELMPSDLRLAH